MKAALLVLILLAAAPAWAENCAKFTNDLAYNACLAAHGPKARMIHVGAAPAARGLSRRRRLLARSRRGRSSMAFSIAR
jgi:hypothetical protein